MHGIQYYLPIGKIQVGGTWNKDSRGWDVKITPSIEADPTARYILERNANGIFDDEITIGVDPSTGLLQTASATTTDETVNAIAGVAASVASALTFGAELGPATSFRGPELQEGFEEAKSNAFYTSFQTTVDYLSRSQSCYVVSPDQSNQTLYAKFAIKIVPLDYDPEDVEGQSTNTIFKGILVRREIPFRLKITAEVFNYNGYRKGTNSFPFQTILLPDPRHNYCLSLARTPLVANSTKVTLVNGIVQSIQQIRPSVVMGIIGAPKTILGALVPIPLQIRQAQENNVEAVDKTLSFQADIEKLRQQTK